jgi:hypothetical protein
MHLDRWGEAEFTFLPLDGFACKQEKSGIRAGLGVLKGTVLALFQPIGAFGHVGLRNGRQRGYAFTL